MKNHHHHHRPHHHHHHPHVHLVPQQCLGLLSQPLCKELNAERQHVERQAAALDAVAQRGAEAPFLSLIHISEPTRH
eukprot:5500648-Karenia_brevis.AAC.1